MNSLVRYAVIGCCALVSVSCAQAAITLTTSTSPSVFGAAVTLTAALPPGATGKVTFYDGVTVLGTSAVSAGAATLSTIMLPAGSRKLLAYYGGDGQNGAGNSNVVTQIVNATPSRSFAAPGAPVAAGGGPSQVVVADFNGDGKADLAVLNGSLAPANQEGLTILLGNGDGTFHITGHYSFAGSPFRVAVADFDGDGKPDLAVALVGSVSILFGNGDGTFRGTASYPVGNYVSEIAAADFNHDGNTDVVTVNPQDNVVTVLLGNGDGTFQPAVTSPTGGVYNPEYVLALGDFNGDGLPDLAVGNPTLPAVSVLLCNGDGSFRAPVNYPFPGGPGFIASADFNGDGKADLALLSYLNVSILQGNGDGTFQTPVVYPTTDPSHNQPQSLLAGDVNGDGKYDIVATGLAGYSAGQWMSSVYVLPGYSSGSLPALITYPIVGQPRASALGDFNGDGRPDLLLVMDNDTLIILPGASSSASLDISVTHAGNFTQGQTGDYTVTVSNGALPGPTIGMVTVNANLPNGTGYVGLSGNGWSCTSWTCQRSDALSPGSSYPPIDAAVEVLYNSPLQVTARVSVSGGGAAGTVTAYDPTTIAISPLYPVLTSPADGATGVSVTPTLSWSAGAPTYYVSVSPAVFGYGYSTATYDTSATVPAGALLPGTRYTWQVVTYMNGSYKSAIWSFTTAGTPPPPSLVCITNVTVTPALRAEATNDAAGDITLTCGGAANTLPLGSAIPTADLTVTLNTALTSRLLPASDAPNASEVLLLIGDPGSGLPDFFAAQPQTVCPTPLTGCTEYVSSTTLSGGTTLFVPTNTPQGNTATVAGYNVFQGIVSGNSVTFHGVPVLSAIGDPTSYPWAPNHWDLNRVFRITNLRADATQILLDPINFLNNAVVATIGVSGPAAFPVDYSNPAVGYVQSGLAATAAAAPILSQCSSQGKSLVNVVSFAESFGTAFKTRVQAQTNTLYAGQSGTLLQNIPGGIFDSESIFVLGVGGGQIAGLADFGTRLKAAFTNVPAGVRLFVSTSNVTNAAMPVTPPVIIGGSAGNSNGAQVFAQLVPGESAAFSAVAPTDFAPGTSGSVPVVELAVVNGSASAVWEVVNTSPNTIETLRFAVYASYTNSAATGTPSVALSFAPPSASGAVPGFNTAAAPVPLFTSAPCAPSIASLSPASAGTGGPQFTLTVNGANFAPGSVVQWTAAATTLLQTTFVSATQLTAVVPANLIATAGTAGVSVIQPNSLVSAPLNFPILTPSLSIAKTHTGNFTQGQNGATYSVVVSNGAGAAPTGGTVTVTETLPSGLTLIQMSGTGWTCPNGGPTCTRSDSVAGGASYPVIVVTVNVSATAPFSLTNQVTVSGGGSAATASDFTSVLLPSYLISTLAGRALPPTALPGTQADIGRALGVATGPAGNIYVSSYSNAVYRLDTNGILTRVAGTSQAGFSGDNGPAVNAQLNEPKGMTVDSAGYLYIADTGNSRIRRVAPNGIITTVAGVGGLGFGGDGGPATSAQLNLPWGVAVDATGNLFIADYGNRRLRKVAVDGTITTIAGTGTEGYSGDNGPAVSAQLSGPTGVAVGPSGSVYLADGNNRRIRKIAGGTITTVAGNGNPGYSGDNGAAVGANLNDPIGIALDASGNLYIADFDRVRRVDAGGIITTVAGYPGAASYSGDGGPAASATLSFPYGVAVDASGNLYIAEDGNRRVRKVAASGIISTVAGGRTGDAGPAPFGALNVPYGVAVDAAGNRYIADRFNHRIRKIAADGTLSTVAGTGVAGYSGDGGPATISQLNSPSGVTVDTAGNLYIADLQNSCVRKVDTGGVITTVAAITYPVAVAVDLLGNLYVPDYGGARVFKVAANGVVTTVAGTGTPGFSGDGGPAVNASLNTPWGLALDPAGNLYIADSSNYRVRKVSTTGTITTVAGNGIQNATGDGGPATSAGLTQVFGIAVDTAGNLYLTDGGYSRVRMVDSAGIIRTIAGAAVGGFGGDGGPALGAPLSGPMGLAVDPNGNIYIADSGNDAIRLLTPVGVRPLLSVNSSHTGNFTAGQSGTYTIIGSNALSAAATAGMVTVKEVLPAGISLSSMSGTGWNCAANSCTRSDALAGGASYPPITATVNVPITSPGQITNQVTVSGGGGVMAGASDLTLVIPAPPSLSITKTHTATFAKGQAGLYTVTVSNSALAGPTLGTVTVTETMPSDLTLVFMAGTGWTCPNGGPTCTRSDTLAGGASYPAITVTAYVNATAPSSVTNQVSVSGGGAASAGASDLTSIAPACSYSVSPSGISTLSAAGTGSFSVTAAGYCPWNAASSAPWLKMTSGASGSGDGTVGYSIAANSGSPRSAAITVGGQTFTVTQAGATGQALRFVPVTPCRIADSRNPTGPFGGPSLAAATPRDFNVLGGPCSIPANALAYSLNLTVVPLGSLGFLSVWPSGQAQPSVSTLNSGDGRIKANAAIVPAGLNGAVTLFGSHPTNVIVDINGYFVPASGAQNLAYYPITPCRLADTRIGTGTFAGPQLGAATSRNFPVLAGPCGIPASAQAYAFNMTVVPTGPLGFLSAWPAGNSQPGSSTLNAPTGTVTSNMAIVPAGTGGAITVITTNATDLIIDVNGYFAPPGAGSLDFYTAIPCRILDTRGATGAFGGPVMGATESRAFPVPSSACGIPASAKAYSLNATAVPPAPLGFLQLWGSGSQPTVSTLNSYDGTIVANAALVPAGTNGVVTAFTSNASHLILDVNGYFQ